MKPLVAIASLLMVAACATQPHEYAGTREPMPEDFRESVMPGMQDGSAVPSGGYDFISGNGEACEFQEDHTGTMSVCLSNAGQRLKASDVISGSIQR